jgi:hypothetical protein
MFLYKKYLKKLKSKSIRFFAKLYPIVLGLTATPDPRVIFIIILNLKYPTLNGFGCNTKPNSLGYGSDCKFLS